MATTRAQSPEVEACPGGDYTPIAATPASDRGLMEVGQLACYRVKLRARRGTREPAVRGVRRWASQQPQARRADTEIRASVSEPR